MSNHKADEKSAPRKSKVSSATAIVGGLGGPKAMAKAAAEGQLVNIPALLFVFDGVTEKIRRSALMVLHCLRGESFVRQIRQTAFNGMIRAPAEDRVLPGQLL